jgi:putative FmdB family regulatory protein
MPLYKYRCEDCQEQFEELVPFAQSNDMECPQCGSHHTEKLVSAFATLGASSSTTSSGSGCSPRGGFT